MTEQQNFQNWDLDKLSDYIVDTHHTYVRKAAPEISKLGEEISKESGKLQAELTEILDVFKTLTDDMEKHMVGEEKYLFPYVKKLLKAKEDGVKLPKPGFGSLENPIKNHYEDHDNADNLMKKINQLSNGFALPNDASENLKKFYSQLKEYEADLERHIYVENEVLFDRCIELEKQVVE